MLKASGTIGLFLLRISLSMMVMSGVGILSGGRSGDEHITAIDSSGSTLWSSMILKVIDIVVSPPGWKTTVSDSVKCAYIYRSCNTRL